jgi:hypothetical protein
MMEGLPRDREQKKRRPHYEPEIPEDEQSTLAMSMRRTVRSKSHGDLVSRLGFERPEVVVQADGARFWEKRGSPGHSSLVQLPVCENEAIRPKVVTSQNA